MPVLDVDIVADNVSSVSLSTLDIVYVPISGPVAITNGSPEESPSETNVDVAEET